MFAALDFSDFAIIALIVIFFASSSTAVYSRFKISDAARLRRMEDKLDLILKHLNLEYRAPAAADRLSPEVKALADDPAKKIEAIALYREQAGVGLKEAKETVEEYIAGRG